MFTGIIETTGKIQQIERKNEIITFTIQSDVLETVAVDQSVAIDGVCLTVVEKQSTIAKFNLVPQTLSKTTLGERTVGDSVNLERAMGATARIDGHFVQGHVDCVGTIVEIHDLGESQEFLFTVADEHRAMLIPRGSIAIDGISLTIAQLDGNQFRVAIIPHTLELTTLGEKNAGDFVNLEFDMIGKYVVNTLKIWKGNTSE